MIKIIGSTGQLGSAAIDFLVKRVDRKNITAIGRNAEKLQKFSELNIRTEIADYNDAESLNRAFAGTDVLFFIAGNDVLHRAEQHKNIVEAAKNTKVGHIVYTSTQRKDESDKSPLALISGVHIATENMIKESGLKYTILKNSLYMENIPLFIGPLKQKNEFMIPAGNGRTSFASRIDMANGAAVILADAAAHENKVYEICSNRSWSFADIADILSRISGRRIIYTSPSADEFIQSMQKNGVPQAAIDITMLFGESIQAGEFEHTDLRLETLLGKKLMTMEEYLQKYI